MSAISPAAVKQLRDRTDMPMGECKSALVESSGDMDKAIEILQSRNKKMQAKREGNETAEGRIGISIDTRAKAGAIVEVRCESAPSAKSDPFIALCSDIADQTVGQDPKTLEDLVSEPFVNGAGTMQDRINEVIGLIRENMKPHRFTRLSGGLFGQYIHHDGTVGVLIQVNGKGSHDELLRDVSAHIAALNPTFLKVEDVPADVVAKEKEAVMADIAGDPKNAGKPANILEKIAEGKLKTKLSEIVLTEQPMANASKYPNTSVGAALKKAELEPVNFVRFKVGAINLA